MIKSLIVSPILTVIIELTVAVLFNIRSKRDIILIILINICTNPAVVYLSNILLLLNNKTIHTAAVMLLEILAFSTEGAMLKNHLENKSIAPYRLSLCMNLISFGTGIILNALSA